MKRGGGANPPFRKACYAGGMDRLHYSRSALIKAIVLILLFAVPAAATIIFAPDFFDGRGGGIIGLLLRATGPQGHLLLAGFCALVLGALLFRAARLLCGSGIAARFDAQGLTLDNGWQRRAAPWRDVLGADILTQTVRVRGNEKSFDILTVRLAVPGGSARQIKIHLRELEADHVVVEHWCEMMRDAQRLALDKPAANAGSKRVSTPAARSFGRRMVNP